VGVLSANEAASRGFGDFNFNRALDGGGLGGDFCDWPACGAV